MILKNNIKWIGFTGYAFCEIQKKKKVMVRENPWLDEVIVISLFSFHEMMKIV